MIGDRVNHSRQSLVKPLHALVRGDKIQELAVQRFVLSLMVSGHDRVTELLGNFVNVLAFFLTQWGVRNVIRHSFQLACVKPNELFLDADIERSASDAGIALCVTKTDDLVTLERAIRRLAGELF